MGNSKSHELILREMSQSVRDLHYAVMTNDRSTVKNLVADGVNINFPWYNPTSPSVKDGSTALIIAVSLNHTEIVEVKQASRDVLTHIKWSTDNYVNSCVNKFICSIVY